MFWKTLVVSLLSLASLVQANLVIRDVDLRAIPDQDQPGQVWKRISSQGYHVFKELNRPLIRVRGSKKSWVLNGTRLEEWPHVFPKASFLTQVVELPDNTLIGGPSGNHLPVTKTKEDPSFRLMAEATDLYWTDHVEGSDVVLANQFYLWNDPNGPDLPDTPDWQPVIQEQPRSCANSWGLFQRGSQEILSPSGSLLKVISKNQNQLSQYTYPTAPRPQDCLP